MARDYRGAEVGGSLAGSASGASLGESSGPKHSLAAHIALYSFCCIYIFVFLFVRVGNPRNPNIPLFLVRFICGSFYLYFF